MESFLRPLLCLCSALALALNLFAAPRDALWQDVAEAEENRLPQTAIAALEPIIEAALADGSHAEALKAIAKKIALETQIQGAQPEESILRLQAQLSETDPALQPTLQALLAHSYWNYFQQNRWRFLQRTPTAEAPSDDFRTWDLARILREIDIRFAAALANESFLQATPIETYDAFLVKGTAPDRYRPTLYDFLAHQALAFYQSGEQAALEAEDVFEISADSPVFDAAQSFLAWDPQAPDRHSPQLKAIQLYQKLLRFHGDDPDPSASFDADLARLVYAHNVAFGEGKDERYAAALKRFISKTANHEISARGLAKLAQYHYEKGALTNAHKIASQGTVAFPDSVGGRECRNLIQRIESKSASIKTELVWNAPWPTIDVSYRNVTNVYFRALKADFEDELSNPQQRYHDQNERLLAATPTLAWQAKLPPTPDFQTRTEKLPAPQELEPGYYHILASHDPEFKDNNNQLSRLTVWVSNLALILRTQQQDTPLSGFVLDAQSGEPIEGADIRIWKRNRSGRHKETASAKTDINGRFILSPSTQSDSAIIVAEHQGHTVANRNGIWLNQRRANNEVQTQTVFFTDRALYRPGQAISYKGIALKSRPSKDSYHTLPNQQVTVSFKDANGQEVARQRHKTNDYGSFSGTFTAPSEGLMGQMRISVESGPRGSTHFNVEEYKRPKFQVELSPPSLAPKLDETVSLTGKATAYTGAAIAAATVKWRVERSVEAPRWCWWWEPPASKAIAHGKSETAADGSFSIQFPATPDRSAPRANEPTFIYTIYADITDSNGETRSSQTTTRAGYTALQAELTANEWQISAKPIQISIATSSLDGAPQAAKATLNIFSLQQPKQTQQAALSPSHYNSWGVIQQKPPYDPTNPDTWETRRSVSKKRIKTDSNGLAQFEAQLPAGPYRAELTSKDRFGQPVTARHTFNVVDPQDAHFATKIPNYLGAASLALEPGQSLQALWGTGYPSGRAFVEIERDGKALASYWTEKGKTQQRIQFPITENHRGGLTLRTTYVRENRAYLESAHIDVPWSNKKLDIKWERFRSKLDPGQAETWTATITGPDAQKAAVEMVAGLYDASLDQYKKHNWPQRIGSFRHEYSPSNNQFINSLQHFSRFAGQWGHYAQASTWSYRTFPPGLLTYYSRDQGVFELSPFAVDVASHEGYRATSSLAGSRLRTELKDAAASRSVLTQEFLEDVGATGATPAPPPPTPDLSQVSARTNLKETAFFYPHLLSDQDGIVKIQFTMPEALTQWRFFGFAHDNDLRSGFLTDTAVTAKDLMVEPNPPRFLREGDTVEFTVKVSNQSDTQQSGTVRLSFADAATLAPADGSLDNLDTDKSFTIPAKESRSYSWRIKVPDGAGVLTYKAVGATATLSDGEEGYLPILSRRILLTESLPLPIRNPGRKEFTFEKLLASGESDTLQHQALTVQMVSQPAWYAVMALPYLMEFPHECSEQLFSRYYANSLASHIAQSDPKIRRVFDLWKNTPALDSPLEKNQELKSVLIEETPWLRQAKDESQARRKVGLLFDANRLENESARALRKLAERQLPDGRWSWFPGGRASDYITLHITTGLGRLQKLGANADISPALRSLDALDRWMQTQYEGIQTRDHPEKYIPSHLLSLYLYGRSFFLQEKPIAPHHQQALDFFLQQSRTQWTKLSSRQSEAHLALALHRFGDAETPAAILKSLKERSLNSEELGMYWANSAQSWWWYHAPIETQALMIEAFAEVAQDAQAVEDLKVWLLKQKQTQNWRTTKATADAVYALLLRGDTLLASDARVAVSLGGETIEPENVEAGTGFYQQSFTRNEIKPEMGQITVSKTDHGVSWGSVHWQYLEDMSQVTPHQATPLTLKKTLFVKENTQRGPVLKPITGPLAVGDELVVRLELRSDRDMEYLHLKDQRGSGTEPLNVLSGYRSQDSLGYYESTRDTASHFFIAQLRKGTYVFEYATRVQLKGRYQSGIATIECMYAPEFNSHSQSTVLEVE